MNPFVGDLFLRLLPITWALKTVVFLALSIVLLTQHNATRLGVWITRLFIGITLVSGLMTIHMAELDRKFDSSSISGWNEWTIIIGSGVGPILVIIAGIQVVLLDQQLNSNGN